MEWEETTGIKSRSSKIKLICYDRRVDSMSYDKNDILAWARLSVNVARPR